MIAVRLSLVLTLLIAAFPALALDKPLNNARLRDNGEIRLSDDLQIGLFQGGKFISEPVRTVADPMGQRFGPRGDPGDRAPHFIWNNPTRCVAGRNTGLQIWTGDNPTATPGAGDCVNFTNYINNLNGRTNPWAENALVMMLPEGTDGIARIHELELLNATSEQLDPYATTGTPRKNGTEWVMHGGSTKRGTAAMWVWSANPSDDKWWENGIALSRVRSNAIFLSKYDSDTSETLQNAIIYDRTNAAALYKADGGNHAKIFDFQTVGALGAFVLGRNYSDTNLVFKAPANFNMSLDIDSGQSTQKSSDIRFSDRGTTKWLAGKDANGQWRVFDAAAGVSPLSIGQGNNTVTLGNTILSGVLIAPVGAPTSAAAPCTTGQIMSDPSYVYSCVAPNTWKRAALSGW